MPIYKKINKDFFKKWTPEMAYVLGFFAADGYITINKRGGHFWSIKITDKDLLINIKKVVQAEHKISIKQANGNHHALYRLQIGSREMCHDLALLGMTERKTKSLSVPKVPQKYFSHFIRGYFDGDGNVWVGFIHTNRKKSSFTLLTVFTSCSFLFLQKLHNRLLKNVVQGGSLYTTKRGYCRLQFSGQDSLKLYDFMYNQCDQSDTHLFLKRKRKVFDKSRSLKNAVVV